MLRRAPTSISLSKRDVTEHLESIDRKKRQDRDIVQRKQAHRVLMALSAHELTDILWEKLGKFGKDEKDEVRVYECEAINPRRVLRGGAPPFWSAQEVGEEDPWEESESGLDLTRPEFGELLSIDPCTDVEIDENLISIDSTDALGSLEELPAMRYEVITQQSSQNPSNVFDYGGFVADNADQSSSFVPQDMSTPSNNEAVEVHRLRYRYPLPRSPLFLAHGANSPERRLTTSLSPHVASYGTPGLLLSQPARRPRSYRPRAISYSFEESERASAAYEQVAGSDSDSTGGRHTSEPQRSLREEMEARSSQNASLESHVPSSSPPKSAETSPARGAQVTPGRTTNQRAHSTSPQIPLPPPFSAVRRNISLAASLPSAHEDIRQSRSPSPHHDLPQLRASPVLGPTTSSHEEDLGHGVNHGPRRHQEETDEGQSSSIRNNLAALPLRLLSVYRSRSPFQSRFDGLVLGHVSPRPPRPQSLGPEVGPGSSARRNFQIYDDSMPAISQPQTPQHLPEARHQSRFHPSYTAPASWRRMEGDGDRDSPQTWRGRGEGIRRRGTRSDSPTGMETPGFQGLYGGQENMDEDILFDGASQRLWALSSARRRGGVRSSPVEESEGGID